MHFLWIDAAPAQPDTYVAFRASFELESPGEVELRVLGANWLACWLDGLFLSEGPARFPLSHPEYESRRLQLQPGRHVLAFQVHAIGAETRMLPDLEPFIAAGIHVGDRELPLTWSCAPLPGYRPGVRRINPLLGWVEWCDTRLNPVAWQSPAFDDSAWQSPVAVERPIVDPVPLSMSAVQTFPIQPRLIAEGPLAEIYGYEFDDVPARFFLRDLACEHNPPRGVWRRYDLGRVRLARPRFVLDLPAGAIVEFAYCEALRHGRVHPYITLSSGPSCNLDHYVARGGMQEFAPLTPRGGRFLEIHVLAPPTEVRFVEEQVIERGYYGEPAGAFACSDPQLNEIWRVGVETLRACAEDAVTDNPTRERGQWTGDVVAVGLDIVGVAWSDLRLFRRALIHCAACAREDGMIAGLTPGHRLFLNTYAAQWTAACLHYHRMTGDRQLLEAMYPAAWRNAEAFEFFMTDKGLVNRDVEGRPSPWIGWTFVDWGYQWSGGSSDMALNLHHLVSLRALVEWCAVLNREADRTTALQRARRLEKIIDDWLQSVLPATGDATRFGAAFQAVGYHCAVLVLRAGCLAPGSPAEAACIDFIKRHMLDCFPNNPTAPRNDDPLVFNPRLITPYFAHYAMPALIERGQMDFVLDQFRRCWGGYLLAEGRTTWMEVFDGRWSHCHQWSGCPTWQLSRYVLGLWSRFDLGSRHYELRLIPGGLEFAKGRLPLPDGKGAIEIDWRRDGERIDYQIHAPVEITLHVPGRPPLSVRKHWRETF